VLWYVCFESTDLLGLGSVMPIDRQCKHRGDEHVENDDRSVRVSFRQRKHRRPSRIGVSILVPGRGYSRAGGSDSRLYAKTTS
jgi:hypothetical protein